MMSRDFDNLMDCMQISISYASSLVPRPLYASSLPSPLAPRPSPLVPRPSTSLFSKVALDSFVSVLRFVVL